MPFLEIRKLVVQLEETCREAEQSVDPPTRKVVAAAVILNPYAGSFIDNLTPLYDAGAELATLLVGRALETLKVGPSGVEAYGKGAIVGTSGELEHAAAILHPSFGAPVRTAVNGVELIPATKKVGGPGSSLVIPVSHKENIWSFDHWDGAEIAVPDSPRPDEILVCLALAVGGRPLHRVSKPG